MITASLGCVKIYKKPRDTDSRGKYIPKHKRGPDVELFKGERHGFLILPFRIITKKIISKSHQSDMTWFSYPRLFHCGSQRRHLLRLKIRGKVDILLVQSKGIFDQLLEMLTNSK